MNLPFKTYSLVAALFLLISTVFAQNDNQRLKFQIAFGVNSPSQSGFVDGFSSKGINFPTINLGAQYMFKKEFGAKLDFGFNRFSNESDAKKRYDYLTYLKQKVAEEVANEKMKNASEWKEKIYYQLMDVQALKLRFGNITFKISENISQYGSLINKYKNDDQIGSKVANLESKLTDLKNTFDGAFDPAEYINSATRMYKVD